MGKFTENIHNQKPADRNEEGSLLNQIEKTKNQNAEDVRSEELNKEIIRRCTGTPELFLQTYGNA